MGTNLMSEMESIAQERGGGMRRC